MTALLPHIYYVRSWAARCQPDMDRWADLPGKENNALGWTLMGEIEGCYNAGKPGHFPGTLDGKNRRVGMLNMIVTDTSSNNINIRQ